MSTGKAFTKAEIKYLMNNAHAHKFIKIDEFNNTFNSSEHRPFNSISNKLNDLKYNCFVKFTNKVNNDGNQKMITFNSFEIIREYTKVNKGKWSKIEIDLLLSEIKNSFIRGIKNKDAYCVDVSKLLMKFNRTDKGIQSKIQKYNGNLFTIKKISHNDLKIGCLDLYNLNIYDIEEPIKQSPQIELFEETNKDFNFEVSNSLNYVIESKYTKFYFINKNNIRYIVLICDTLESDNIYKRCVEHLSKNINKYQTILFDDNMKIKFTIPLDL